MSSVPANAAPSPARAGAAAEPAVLAGARRGEPPATPARPRRSLLSRLIVTMSVAVLASEAILIVPLVLHAQRGLLQAEQRAIALAARVILHHWESRTAVLAARGEDRTAWLERFCAEVDAHAAELGATTACVFDPDGRPLRAPAAAEAGALLAAAREAAGRGQPARARGQLLHLEPIPAPEPAQPPLGTLLLAAPLGPLHERVIHQVLLALGLVLVVLLLTGVVAIVFVYRHLLRRFRRLAEANRALLAGEEERALIPEHEIPNDELGDLMRSRNEVYRLMLDYQRSIRDKSRMLARQGLELERWARELERRVRAKQAELERAHEQLLASEKLAATGRLAAGLAHELNNPLASIAGYAEDLLQLARDPALAAHPAFAEFPDSLRTIEEQAYRCKRILTQLLSFARPAPFAVRPQALAPVIQGVLPLVEHRARGRDVALILDLDPDLGPALVDRANLEHVLVNLIENAFDAIEQPSGRITLRTRALAGGRQAIEVEDTGKGMDAETRRRIFDPFFTTKPFGSGTGLGLSICHAIVQKMGGAIEVDSAPGRGSTFTVIVPAAVAAAPAPAAPPLLAVAGDRGGPRS
ncbi:MAG: hypothetical protein KatS3mg102_0173 [Planctomycetota bacterium]|nr:MAG: hypothetical protein KatS3mg102_0173 [Planctomycetota bacterium]